jgi:hypothetical protein
MPPLKSVVDLLAEQPEPVLIQMRDNFKADLARLRVEIEQVEQALTKKARRGGRTPGGRAAGESRKGLTRWQVFQVVKDEGRPMSPSEVRDVLHVQGLTHVTTAQVRNHLTRLHEVNNSLVKLPDATYVVPGGNGGVPKTEADDPLFTESEPHREDAP